MPYACPLFVLACSLFWSVPSADNALAAYGRLRRARAVSSGAASSEAAYSMRYRFDVVLQDVRAALQFGLEARYCVGVVGAGDRLSALGRSLGGGRRSWGGTLGLGEKGLSLRLG